MTLTIIYSVIVIMTIFFLAYDLKHPKKKRSEEVTSVNSKDQGLLMIILLIISFVYTVIGYIFNNDMIAVITFHNGGGTISFVGIFLTTITSVLTFYIIKFVRKRTENKRS